MKQGTLTTRAILVLLFLMVCAYLGASLWRSLDQDEQIIPTYRHTVDDSVEVTALLVRQEAPVLGGSAGAIVDVVPDQGERVAAGAVVAYLYQDEAALGRRQEIRQLQLEREQLLYSLQQDGTGNDAARLDQSIRSAMLAMRTSAAYGDLTALEDQALTFKSLVIRRGWSAQGGAAEIQAEVEALEGQIQALQAASAQDTVPVRTQQSGVFSAQADGYEAIAVPQALEGLTAAGLESWMDQDPEAPAGAVGRIITSSTWYLAANVPLEAAERMLPGDRVPVRFSRDWSGEVEMTVERVGEPEGEVCLVILSSDHFLAETSLLRKQTVEIVFHSVTGIRVPKLAVREALRTSADPETGEETTVQVPVVYVLTGAWAEEKEVELLVDDGDYYLVEAALPAVPTEAQLRDALRPGDQVLISSEELYDGKIVLDQ